jgi:nickel-type superoxide dismutase maturation protease
VRLVLVSAAGLAAVAAIASLARPWLDVVEVRGRSMAPALLPGDLLLVERWTYRRRRPLPGEVVLVRDPRVASRELVKRVAATDGAVVVLRGDAPEASTDSRTFGQLPVDAVRWRVGLRYWPPARIGTIGVASAAATEGGDRLDA